MLGELGDGGDTRVDEAGPLAHPHAGHEQQIIVGADLNLALRAAEACPHALVLPRDGGVARDVVVEQTFQGGAPLEVHRQQFVDAVARGGAVAQHQVHVRGHRDAGAGQRVGVGGELKEGLDLDRTRELGVPQPVLLGVQYQEVGETDEPAVEHRGLIDHRRPAFDGAHGGLGRRGQPVHGVFGPADDRDVLLGQFAKLVEVALFVLAAELGGAGQQFVFDGDGRAASEFGVERAQQCVLAAGGGCEVGCAVDDAGLGPVGGDEHDATVCELYDISLPARTWVTRTQNVASA